MSEYTHDQLVDAFRAYSRGPRIQTFLSYLMNEVAEKADDDADTLEGHDMYYFMWKNEYELLERTRLDCLNKQKYSITKING